MYLYSIASKLALTHKSCFCLQDYMNMDSKRLTTGCLKYNSYSYTQTSWYQLAGMCKLMYYGG